MNRLIRITCALLLVNCLLAWSCERPGPVGPTGVGGAVATGGASAMGGLAASGGQGPTAGSPGTGGSVAVDGKAICLAITLASLDRQTEARDNGMTVAALAASLCGYQTVQDCFARGVCK